MEFLPVELISHILQFLPSLEDRKAASLVCRTWYEAYQSPVFRGGEVLVVQQTENIKALTELSNANRKYYHVSAHRLDITESSSEFWARFGPHIRSLSLWSCDVREKMFVSIISNCRHLESLSLQHCRELFMPGRLFEDEKDRRILEEALSGLKTLNIGCNPYLSDATFVKFTSLSGNIRELYLPRCHISFHPGLYLKYYSRNGHAVPSESVFTFPVVLDFIRSNAPNLKLLSFKDTFIDSDSLASVAKTKDLALEKLHLQGCLQLTNDGVVALSTFQSSLTHLDLAFCPRITDLSLLFLSSQLPKLKSLTIQGCRAITDWGISDLWKLSQLNRLNLSQCELIHDEGLTMALCKVTNPNLRELYVSHLGDVSDDAIVRIMEHLPNLRVLDLGYCYNAVTDKSVQAIFTHAKHLATLTLTMSVKLTDRGLTGMNLSPTASETPAKHFRIPLGSRAEIAILREARLKQAVQEMGEGLTSASDLTGASVKDLKHLRDLNLSDCNCISDVSLKYAFQFGDLRTLNLSNCRLITDAGLVAVADNSRSIETLALENCHSVTDDGVLHVFKNLKRLRVLTLGSIHITNRIVKPMCRDACSLKCLDVRHCPRLTDLPVDEIRQRLPQLETISCLISLDDGNGPSLPLPPPPPPPLSFYL